MIHEILVSRGKKSKKEKKDDVKDLKKLNTIRGRLINWLGILELVFKDYTGNDSCNFGPLKKATIKKLKREINNETRKSLDVMFKDEIIRFSDFEKSLDRLHKYRNDWAHGITFYVPRENNSKPKNYIFNKKKKKSKSIVPPYFDELSKDFSVVSHYLKAQGLWELKKFKISEF